MRSAPDISSVSSTAPETAKVVLTRGMPAARKLIPEAAQSVPDNKSGLSKIPTTAAQIKPKSIYDDQSALIKALSSPPPSLSAVPDRAPASNEDSSFNSTGFNSYTAMKTAFDVISSLGLLIVTSPLLAAIAVAVKCTSHGPIMYNQRRLTKDGKEFVIYKFRTMVVDAEKSTGPTAAFESDPRVTPIGNLLRVHRLDELPQLLNVLKGEMSLVGPRPERPETISALKQELAGLDRRLAVKAGISGLAQIRSGYAACSISHRKRLAWDRLYVRRRSLKLDLYIAFKTIYIVISGHGAR